MTQGPSSPLAGDVLKKAVHYFSELLAKYPDKTRLELLHKVELKFDLSPLECEFLNKYLAETK